ncbi:MAG: alpha/beta fold hydrolase [Xanthomonadales bacterium]|nr:Serine/threonine-protein kinase PknD [Xanthomonadales bacterium]MCC6592543.1 alpha/beta fold hydrolase [Xanthomonadales bacterium]
MPTTVRCVYKFGPWRVDGALRQLARDGQPVPTPAATLELLLALLEAHPQPLGRRALDARVHYDGNSIDEHLQWLAAMLGEDAEGRPLVEAVPRRGWRLMLADLRRTDLPGECDSTLTERFAAGIAGAPARVTASGVGVPARRGGFRPGSTHGRYEVIALLGSGGMGKVYLAHDVRLERKVALKLLSGRMTRNQEWLRRFEREARAIGALNHPNILTVHEVGEIEGHHYIATEFVDGRTLRGVLKDGPLTPLAALVIATQAAAALAAAHTAGIVHRDLKPENLMLRGDGWLKLLDFGLAKPLHWKNIEKTRVETVPGVIMGTANYMSPEQARGQPVDARSDVFSLGVLLYEMLTGTSPFAGPTTSDVIAAVLERQPLPLAQRVPGIPAELDRIVARCLRKDREQRYVQAGELEQDLKRLQQELELRARFGDTLPPALARIPAMPAPHTTPPLSRPSHASQLDSEAAFDIPEVHYALSGEVNIAWQSIGEGPIDLVFVMGWVSHLEYFWTEPHFARFLRRLATFARVILFDKRGTGLSDRVPLEQLPTLEQRMDDVRAVMEAAGSERAVLCGVSEGGPMASLFAATYPERTIALVMMGSYARRLRCEDYPWGPDEAGRDAFLEQIRREWGGPVGIEVRAPSMAADPAFRAWWAAYLRRGASPAAAVALTRMNSEIDIRRVLPSVRVPTLVLHRRGDACLRVEEGRYLAEHIPGARFVELPGEDHLPFVGAQEEFLDEIEEFLTGVRHASGIDRVLATVLVARVHGELPDGDRAQHHQSFVRKEIELFKGRLIEIDATHALASFDGPARAIRAACAIGTFAERLMVPLQCGLHTGECDVIGERMGGIAVEIAREVAASAAPGEVRVSSTVKDLVAGSGLCFSDRGLHGLPDALGDWRLYAVMRG